MVEKYLGKDAADSIFTAAVITAKIPEKQACALADGLEKDAFPLSDVIKSLKGLGGAATGAVDKLIDYAGSSAKAVGLLATIGAGTGVAGASIWDMLKTRYSQEDPETEFNNKAEAMYGDRKRELADAKWMDRVRRMRDELRRGYKKMSTEEYAEKYQALQDALDERKS